MKSGFVLWKFAGKRMYFGCFPSFVACYFLEWTELKMSPVQWNAEKNHDLKIVRAKGVEPSRPKAPEPKSGASTNSATLA